MSDSYEVEHNGIDGEIEMGSLKHSLVQSRLAGLLQFKCDQKLSILTELSLDIKPYDLSKYRLDGKYELKPDICAYLECPTIPKNEDDLITVSQIPDLVIEIRSPSQLVEYLMRKTRAYFEIGVKSAWIISPSQRIITVYSKQNQYKNFDTERDTEVVDEVMDIHLPIQDIFN